MDSPVAAPPRQRPRPNPRRVVVHDVAHLSPLMRRVTFAGDELRSFAWSGPAAHIKLVFPEPGSQQLPEVTPDGPRPTTIRTYTPRRFDAESGRLEVDFVLHGEGPASSWAAQAMPGQELILMGPGPGYVVDAAADWFVLAGDDAALPAIETLLDATALTTRVTALIEVASLGEVRALPGHADVRWFVRAHPNNAGSALVAAFAGFAWPSGSGRVYIGCEADAMRRIRSAVLEASGLDREHVVGRGYWRLGNTNHPDHDYAKE